MNEKRGCGQENESEIKSEKTAKTQKKGTARQLRLFLLYFISISGRETSRILSEDAELRLPFLFPESASQSRGRTALRRRFCSTASRGSPEYHQGQ